MVSKVAFGDRTSRDLWGDTPLTEISDSERLKKTLAGPSPTIRGRTALLSPAAVAELHDAHPQTVLNAIEAGILPAEVYVMGAKQKIVCIGVRPEAAKAWAPRRKGRPRKMAIRA